MSKKYLIILLLFSLSFCRKADDIAPIQSLQVFVIEGLTNAVIIWEKVKDYPDSSLEFKVFINESLLDEHLKTRSFTVSNLAENTAFKGKIEAWSAGRKIAEQEFDFKTLENQPPNEFSISEYSIGKNSVTLKWNKANDPENRTVVYDVYLDNQLKTSGINRLSCILNDLSPNTTYSGEIVARDSSGNSTRTSFTFNTINVTGSILVHSFFEYQGYKREFAFYVPAEYDSAKSTPLVINLHGANGNAWNEIGRTPYKKIADRENFILLMPQALEGTYAGLTLFQWNAHYIFPWDDASLLNYLIDYMFTRYHVDLSKIYLSGMSNGGYMTFFAIRVLQDRIAAIAPISGLMSANIYEDYTLKRPVPLCYMHGTADDIVRIDGYPSAEMIINLWIANNKCTFPPVETQLPDIAKDDNSTVTLYQYNGDSPASEIQFYKIVGGGHSIPGVEPEANQDINAYEISWAFFKRHTFPEHAAGQIVEIK